ncbi:MAG TPA: glycosyltransferase [Methylocystis sp.]|nr:glycosyltransferase [Methylocystis sp.]
MSLPNRLMTRIRHFSDRGRHASGVIGHLDGVRENAVCGWAWDRAHIDRPVLIDVFADGVFIGQRLANVLRPDLRSHQIGDGRHAFEFSFPPMTRPADSESVRAFALSNERVELFCDGEIRAMQSRLSGPESYLRTTFSSLLRSIDTHVREAKTAAPAAQGEKLFDRLFAASPIPGLPAMLGATLCGYLDHNRYKWDIAEKFDTTVSKADYAMFLKSYIEAYGRARRPMRVPLSAGDLAFLLEGPTADAPLLSSRAQRLFGDADNPLETGASSNFEDIYRWAVHDSLHLGVEDCLVSGPHVDLLAARADDDAGESYPLSRFMQRFIADNVYLSGLDLSREEGRQLAYLAVQLFSLTSQHYLRYVPAEWLRAFTSSADRGESPFEFALSRVFGDLAFDREMWRAWVSGQGFDCATMRFRSLTDDGHRLHSRAIQVSSAERVDVQLIGPFSRRLGIADSCRTLADALRNLDYSQRFCDFSLDYPNLVRPCDDFALADPGPATINILHFNLEELPSAIAYLPDVFTDSYVIGFPYLELPSLHPAQMLGLTLVNEIWSATDFIARTLAPYVQTHKLGAACRRLRPVGRSVARRLALGDLVGDGDFVFLTSGDALSGAHRKNPLGVVRAFLAAFPHDESVKLVVKTHSVDRVGPSGERETWRRIRNVAAECSRIKLIDRVLEDDEHTALIEAADCFVSLHRAEGFGFHILEAMTLGTPVVATAYSGNMDFCNEQTAFLVPHRTVPIEKGQYPRVTCGQTWVEPDFAASVEILKTVRREARARARIAEAAKTFSEAQYSTEAFSRRLDRRLTSLLASPGEALRSG